MCDECSSNEIQVLEHDDYTSDFICYRAACMISIYVFRRRESGVITLIRK